MLTRIILFGQYTALHSELEFTEWELAVEMKGGDSVENWIPGNSLSLLCKQFVGDTVKFPQN